VSQLHALPAFIVMCRLATFSSRASSDRLFDVLIEWHQFEDGLEQIDVISG
jgi:hypothetical protein